MAKTKEEQIAELVARIQSEIFGDGEDSMQSQIKTIIAELGLLKELDLKALCTEVDRVKSGHEMIVKRIKRSKQGLYIPGAEDAEFSLVKAAMAIKSGNWDKAGAEKELMDAARGKASQVVGDSVGGGYFVPDQTIPDVIGAMYRDSVFISLDGEGRTRISLLTGLTGGSVKVPKFKGGLVAYWIGEEDTYAESAVSVGDVTMSPKKLGILVRMTDSMRRLQGYGFEQLLRADMVREGAQKLDWSIAYGRGTDNMPRGIFNMDGIKVMRAETGVVYDRNVPADVTAMDAITDWDGGELDFDKLEDMELALQEDDVVPDSSFTKVGAPRFWKRLKRIKVENYSTQSTGQPYLLGAPYMSNDRLKSIIGDFAETNQFGTTDLPGAAMGLPTNSVNAKYTPIVVGNLSNVVLGRWGGVEIADDGGKGTGFTSDHTYIKFRLYADVGAREERALCVCPDAVARD